MLYRRIQPVDGRFDLLGVLFLDRQKVPDQATVALDFKRLVQGGGIGDLLLKLGDVNSLHTPPLVNAFSTYRSVAPPSKSPPHSTMGPASPLPHAPSKFKHRLQPFCSIGS